MKTILITTTGHPTNGPDNLVRPASGGKYGGKLFKERSPEMDRVTRFDNPLEHGTHTVDQTSGIAWQLQAQKFECTEDVKMAGTRFWNDILPRE